MNVLMLTFISLILFFSQNLVAANLKLACDAGLAAKELSLEELRANVSKIDNLVELSEVEQAINSLPKPDTAEFSQLRSQLINDLNEKGFSLLDLRRYLPQQKFKNFYEKYIELTNSAHLGSEINVANWGRTSFQDGEISFFDEHKRDDLRGLNASDRTLKVFAHLKNWMDLLFMNMSKRSRERVSSMELRFSTAARGINTGWHVDGSALTGFITLYGELGPEILLNPELVNKVRQSQDLSVPIEEHLLAEQDVLKSFNGFLVVITGQKQLYNSKPTAHRSPPKSNKTERFAAIWRN